MLDLCYAPGGAVHAGRMLFVKLLTCSISYPPPPPPLPGATFILGNSPQARKIPPQPPSPLARGKFLYSIAIFHPTTSASVLSLFYAFPGLMSLICS
jgi:hypothetical protein